MDATLTGFIAYPSSPREVVETLSRLPEEAERQRVPVKVTSWEANDIAGRCLIDPIIEQLESVSFLMADITWLNFNVLYEIGYAMAKRKRIILLKNSAITPQVELVRELGVFDTLGHKYYQNTGDLCKLLRDINDIRPLPLPEKKRKGTTPFFIIWPNERTESEIRLLSRIKKQARVGFSQFDPQEEARLSLNRALDSVVNAEGIILPLISSNRRDAKSHNLRCAFIAGLSHGLDKETLILQAGSEPVPLDYRDAVSFYNDPSEIDTYLADFTPKVYEKTFRVTQDEFPELTTPIGKLYIGQSNAENEHEQLNNYYIQTEEFLRVVRGDIQVVTGRKGSGKTALFYQVRNKIRNDKRNVVLDLNPEGFQLRKLKTIILDRMEEGTQEHTLTAFWEYVLYLEICYKLLEKDKKVHLHNHELRPKYLHLQELYQSNCFVAEGDFAERLLTLIEKIEERFSLIEKGLDGEMFLKRDQITEFLYLHDLSELRASIVDYATEKKGVWILFDNIDKGWAATGVDDSDLLSLRCLIEALRKISRDFRRSEVKCHGVVFIRNDIFELLVTSTPDRGKVTRVSLDWTDPNLLLEMLRYRFVYSLGLDKQNPPSFDQLWNSLAVSHMKDGNETSTFLISRSLMRPRSLLDLLLQCKSHAVNLGHTKLEADDFKEGEFRYSTELVAGISLEIQDILPCAKKAALYAFVEADYLLDNVELNLRLAKITSDKSDQCRLRDLLFWYGFLGFVRTDNSECYIYTVGYDMQKFQALCENIPESDRVYLINPAFHRGLEIIMKQ